LRTWGIDIVGYKGGPGDKAAIGEATRSTIVEAIADATQTWLDLTTIVDRCVRSDHILDGLVSALVAIAARHSKTATPEDPAAALTEGWIHVPTGPLALVRPESAPKNSC